VTIVVDDDEDEVRCGPSSDSIDEPIVQLPDFLDLLRSGSGMSTANVDISVQRVTYKVDRKGKGKERVDVLELDEFDGIEEGLSVSPKRAKAKSAHRMEENGNTETGRAVKKRKSGSEQERNESRARLPVLDKEVSTAAAFSGSNTRS
jgi:hypothetical protein